MQLRDPWKKLLFAAIILSAMDGNAQKSGSNDPIQWCYCYIDAHEGESVWRKTDCDLTTLDEKQIISLQYKLKHCSSSKQFIHLGKYISHFSRLKTAN